MKKFDPLVKGVVYKGNPPSREIIEELGYDWVFVGPTVDPQEPGWTFVQKRCHQSMPISVWYKVLEKYNLHANGWKVLYPPEWKWWK